MPVRAHSFHGPAVFGKSGPSWGHSSHFSHPSYGDARPSDPPVYANNQLATGPVDNPQFTTWQRPVSGSIPKLQLQRVTGAMATKFVNAMPAPVAAAVGSAHPFMAAAVGGLVGGVIGWFAPFVGFKVGALVGAALGGGTSMYLSGSLPFGATDVTFGPNETPWNVSRLSTQDGTVKAWDRYGRQIQDPEILKATMQFVHSGARVDQIAGSRSAPPVFAPDVAGGSMVEQASTALQTAHPLAKLGLGAALIAALMYLYHHYIA